MGGGERKERVETEAAKRRDSITLYTSISFAMEGGEGVLGVGLGWGGGVDVGGVRWMCMFGVERKRPLCNVELEHPDKSTILKFKNNSPQKCFYSN